jgi:hypothetical protein
MYAFRIAVLNRSNSRLSPLISAETVRVTGEVSSPARIRRAARSWSGRAKLLMKQIAIDS